MKKIISDSMAGPLVSWDIFLNTYHQLMQKGDDLKAIQQLSEKAKWKVAWNFQEELVSNNSVIVVTDIKRKIVFSSSNIEEMTGYSSKEMLGKSPKILQGEATDKNILKFISAQIEARQPFEATIVNYRNNGEMYNCCIKAFPVFDEQDKLVNFIAFEKAA
jgi:PAS domain S-box-containing protein